MNDIFWNSSIDSATGEIYIPKGTGPFPTIIIFDTGLIKSTRTYATFYAKKMKEKSFIVCIVKLNLNKKIELCTIIEYILSQKEVNSNKVYLIEIERNNLIDLNIELYRNYFQGITSINCFNLND
ncbi:hypothetical protein [Acinetobacter oleivorans]|uniref:hypothetical protein n=1 Tax=Acinetobacter oleivorans TaxID=1148157 RepID=UPI001CD55A52|nr:hypothetical protein [Acinetobacter oleivorans]